MKSDEFGHWSSKAAQNAATRVAVAESDKPMQDGPPSGPPSGPPLGPPSDPREPDPRESDPREPASSDPEIIDALPDADQNTDADQDIHADPKLDL